jgi:hypothetical protein
MQIEQHRPRGVGRIGRVQAPAAEPRQQEAVDRAEGDLASAGTALKAGKRIEQPADF